MNINEIKNSNDYFEHHSATRRGYVSRRSEGKLVIYSGRFGVGYILMLPRWDTTQYCSYIYYIRKEG